MKVKYDDRLKQKLIAITTETLVVSSVILSKIAYPYEIG